jgi:hypothetical protein
MRLSRSGPAVAAFPPAGAVGAARAGAAAPRGDRELAAEDAPRCQTACAVVPRKV